MWLTVLKNGFGFCGIQSHNMEHGTFQQIGISKNEADVYQALLQIGEAKVGEISKQSKVHRRNVYDVLNRLLEKGLAFIVLSDNENHYQAVNPNKLNELISEQKSALSQIIPDLQKMMKSEPSNESVMIYRGRSLVGNGIFAILSALDKIFIPLARRVHGLMSDYKRQSIYFIKK